VYRNHNGYEPDYQFTPPGAAYLTPWLIPVIMPDGSKWKGAIKNNRTGFEVQPTYKIGESNTMVAGITYEEMKQYDFRAQANFISTGSPLLLYPCHVS